MCFSKTPVADHSSHRTSEVNPPTMSDLVWETTHGRKVKCMDIGCNAVIAAVGLGLLAFGVTMLVIGILNYGWTVKMIPIYVLLGISGITGTVLCILSVKRMIDSCRKNVKYRKEARGIT